MSERALNILIVEEDTTDFVLINGYINKALKNPGIIYCQDLDKAVEINSAINFDVLLLSLKFAQALEKEQFKKLLAKADHPAVIILTDSKEEEPGLEAINLGAQDYIRKENLNSRVLYKSITYAIARRSRNLQVTTSRQHYKKLFDRNPLPVLVYELEHKKIVLVNEAAESFYGYSGLEFMAMNIRDLQQQNENNAKSFAGIHHHLKKNGDLILVEVITNLILLDHKTCRLAVIVDQTKPQNATQPVISSEMQQQLLLLESAINKSTDGVIITKKAAADFCNSEIVYSNPAFLQLTGFTAQEMLGQKPTMVHKKHPVKEVSANTQAFSETFETRFTNYKNNTIDYWVDYSISPVEDEHGNITHFVAVYRDVSERKKAETVNENVIRNLQESNQELKQFSYVISHNLRAPLANLTGLLSLLDTETITDEDTLELIGAVKSSTNNLNITVNDIIDVLLIRSEDNKIAEPLAVQTIWENVKATLSNLIETANVDFEENFTGAPIVFFKKNYLESVLINLLSNALKYKSDDRKLIINLKTYVEQEQTILLFEDNGIGIDLNRYGQQVFGLYKRFTNKAEGKGLGLYIVQAQINALGGKIEVKSELNKGTRFTIYFKNK